MSRTNRQEAKRQYPPLGEFLVDLFLDTFRGTFLAACFTTAVYQPFVSLVAASGLSECALFVIMTSVIHTGVYVLMNGFFALCDAKGFLSSHKLPRTKRMIPTAELMKGTLLTAAFNQIVVYPIALYYMWHHLLNMPPSDAPLPSFLTIWGHFICAHHTNEFLFYVAHRVMHDSTFLYRTIHKKHHNYVGTVGFAAEHAHPIEGVLANAIPTGIYCLAAGVHPLIWFVWFGWRLMETYEAHSGYCFENTLLSKIGLLHAHRAKFHDHHHTVNIGNFGGRHFDYIFGTMDNYVLYLEAADKKSTE